MPLEYSQPEFYHFSEDSVSLARTVAQEIKDSDQELLDLFSGSGIVALELSERLVKTLIDKPLRIELLELQEDFLPHLKKNIENTNSQNQFHIQIIDFMDYIPDRKFDIITANPPYFTLNEGKIPLDPQRSLCRHQTGFEWNDIFLKVNQWLTDSGRFYFLAREIDFKKFKNHKVKILTTIGETGIYFYQK